MTSISRHREGGFSLVEVMVALTVITAGIIGTISMV
ncbi:MAG: type IV pilus modification PilV family protein, partial [Parvibaculales bacterium]